jgi:urea transport system substrate-binding protein
VVGEEYIPFGSDRVAEVVAQIRDSDADVILNTINGDANRAFFRGLRQAGVSPADKPVVSFSLAEPELRGLTQAEAVGHYAAWGYFQSLESEANREFVKRFQARYGPQRVTSAPIEAAYFGVHLWAQAVEQAGSTEPAAIREAMRGQRFRAPEGEVWIDPETLHTWKYFRFARVKPGGQFEILWSNDRPIEPEPFPPSRPREEWDALVEGFHQQWGGQWLNPGP